MTWLKKSVAVACLVSLSGTTIASPALAFRTSTGAVSGVKKLNDGIGSTDGDLTFSPMLLEMAKLIGRTGLPPGFFLQNDGAGSEEQGVDLRTLLLYQAGLIKMPIRLITGKKPQQSEEQLPTLVLQNLAMPRGTNMPSMGANSSGGTVTLAAGSIPRTPEKDRKPHVDKTEEVEAIVAKITTTSACPQIRPERPPLKADVPQLAMALPGTVAAPTITKNAFRFWTLRDEASSNSAQAAETETKQFDGTYVVATTGAIKSIVGRRFTLNTGKIIASNQGGELIFSSPVASVSIEPNATAVVEVTEKNGERLMKVYALEAAPASNVVVQLDGAKPQSISLAAGEELIVGDHALSNADLQNAAGAKKLNSTAARATFNVKEFVDRDLVSRAQTQANDAEQYSTLAALKKRLSGQQ